MCVYSCSVAAVAIVVFHVGQFLDLSFTAVDTTHTSPYRSAACTVHTAAAAAAAAAGLHFIAGVGIPVQGAAAEVYPHTLCI
jgi:hypothetical protein